MCNVNSCKNCEESKNYLEFTYKQRESAYRCQVAERTELLLAEAREWLRQGNNDAVAIMLDKISWHIKNI